MFFVVEFVRVKVKFEIEKILFFIGYDYVLSVVNWVSD